MKTPMKQTQKEILAKTFHNEKCLFHKRINPSINQNISVVLSVPSSDPKCDANNPLKISLCPRFLILVKAKLTQIPAEECTLLHNKTYKRIWFYNTANERIWFYNTS